VASEVTTALIAAGVSLVVAGGTGAVTAWTTRASLRRDQERQLAEFRRTMTAKLYDRRVATYPGLFAATAAVRRSRLNEAQDLHRHLQDSIEQVNEWHGREGGLLLSDDAHQRMLALRHTVRKCIDENP
jgi:hypothetical protein